MRLERLRAEVADLEQRMASGETKQTKGVGELQQIAAHLRDLSSKFPSANKRCVFCAFKAQLDYDVMAKHLGFERTSARSHGQPVYRRGNEYISPDVDRHDARRHLQRRPDRDGGTVTKYEINKYPPSLFKHARFLREDWTACTDIGRPTPHGTLDQHEYLRIEGLYVDAVTTLARTVEPHLLPAHDVEFWHTTSDSLTSLGLADVLDGAAAPAEGEPIADARLDNLVRRCMRDVAWLELMVAPNLLVHFGYDMRLIVASSTPLAGPLAQIRSSGLFVYDSDAPLSTLDTWGESLE